MGCNICCKCGGKFESYDAEEYAEDLDDVNYDTCPDCLEKAEHRAEEKKLIKSQEAELVALRKEVKSLRSFSFFNDQMCPISTLSFMAILDMMA